MVPAPLNMGFELTQGLSFLQPVQGTSALPEMPVLVEQRVPIMGFMTTVPVVPRISPVLPGILLSSATAAGAVLVPIIMGFTSGMLQLILLASPALPGISRLPG